jgi:hypothetical protein
VLADLINQSQAVSNAVHAMATARMNRNSIINGKNGLIETTNAVKDYVRSVYGVRSEQAKELGKLRLVA